MSVQKGYYHVTTTKLGRDVSAKPTNYHTPVTTVQFTRNALTSSVPRAMGTKTVQPKIMSPTTNHSAQRRKYVTSLSIIPKEKIPKIVVLPSIDKDIAGSAAKQVSTKIPATANTTVNKTSREAPKNEKVSQSKRYVSCLHTSLSTEWKKADSFDTEDIPHKEKARRTSSLQIDCNSDKNTARSAASNRRSSPGLRVEDKNISKLENRRCEENTSTVSANRGNVKGTTGMNKNSVRIQYIPLRKSFTIKDSFIDTKALGTSANLKIRCQDQAPQRLRPRMLPKSRFRVKIQKCHHKNVNISDSFNASRDKRVKPLEKASRSVVIQDKSPRRSFSVKKPTLLSTR